MQIARALKCKIQFEFCSIDLWGANQVQGCSARAGVEVLQFQLLHLQYQFQFKEIHRRECGNSIYCVSIGTNWMGLSGNAWAAAAIKSQMYELMFLSIIKCYGLFDSLSVCRSVCLLVCLLCLPNISYACVGLSIADHKAVKFVSAFHFFCVALNIWVTNNSPEWWRVALALALIHSSIHRFSPYSSHSCSRPRHLREKEWGTRRARMHLEN